MKLFKKVLAVTTLLTLAFSAVPASAATDVIDFEDGNTAGFSSNKTPEGKVDGDNFELSVVDYNGSKALFVDVQDETQVPKLAIDVPSLVGVDNLEKVRTVEFDLTIVNPSGEAAGWNGGSFGANIGADGSQWYDPIDWVIEEYEKAEVSQKATDTFVKGMGFTNGAAGSKYLFMKWANANDFYVDNVRFLDADGNPVTLVATVPAADDATVAKDTKAPAAEATTEAPKTGSTSYAVFFAAGAVITLAGAFVFKRRKSIEA